MNYKTTEIERLEISSRWLDEKHSENSYEYALNYSSSNRYGLNEKTVGDIRRHKIESYSVADSWLRSIFPEDGSVQIVFGKKEVVVIASADFLSSWKNIFVPGRDDAIVLHNDSKLIAFYSHREEIEIGLRCA